MLIIGSMIESGGMGTPRLLGLYLVTTIGGYLFGATCTDNLSVGPFPGIFGIMAALFSNVIKNWKAMEKLDSMRFMYIIFALGIFAISLMITWNQYTIGNHFDTSDIYSNLGGFIIGIFVAMIVIKPARAPREADAPKSCEKIVTWIGWGCSALFFIIMFPVFFFAKTRQPVLL